MTPEFEIRVALIGYVSVGKTTVLNALLKDKFSEVSMKRTTAGINSFRLSVKDKTQENEELYQVVSSWSPDEHRSATSTLDEITKDNQKLRGNSQLQEKSFDIALDELLLEMRKDTRLVLIDVPGINEAGTSKMYKDYLTKNWHSFDCVVVVLDGLQGVNTDEQVQVLEFAKAQCTEAKSLPLIILLNKMDDLAYEEEHQVLVTEATHAIEQLFDAPLRVNSLNEIVGGTARPVFDCMRTNIPIVIPLSARQAYIYRVASSLTLDQFKSKIEESLVNKLGRECYGLQWRRFAEEEQYCKAHEMVCDTCQY